MPTKKHAISSTLSTEEKVRRVAGWLLEKKARDLAAFDVSALCSFTEAMIVATAANVRQAQALADFILLKCGEERIALMGMDGYKTGQWILVDLNDVLVHIFLEETRRFYNIEGLWSEGADIALPEPSETAMPATQGPS